MHTFGWVRSSSDSVSARALPWWDATVVQLFQPVTTKKSNVISNPR
jgi:hypothetical protein